MLGYIEEIRRLLEEVNVKTLVQGGAGGKVGLVGEFFLCASAADFFQSRLGVYIMARVHRCYPDTHHHTASQAVNNSEPLMMPPTSCGS